MQYSVHPLAELIPAMTEPEYAALRDSIERDGLRDPIVLLAGKILDGRHRARACEELGIIPVARVYNPQQDGPNPIRYVQDKNLHRRHLSPSQRAMVAAALLAAQQEAAEVDIAPKPKAPPQEAVRDDIEADDEYQEYDETFSASGKDEDEPEAEPVPPMTQKEVAESLGVSRRSVQTAAKVLDKAPEEAAKVSAGETSLNAAAQAAEAKLAQEKLKEKRSAILKRIRANCGKDFAKAVDTGTLLKTLKELAAFEALNDEEQAKTAPLVATGWTVKNAFKHVTENVGLNTTVRELIHRAIASKEAEFTSVVDGWEISMIRVG